VVNTYKNTKSGPVGDCFRGAMDRVGAQIHGKADTLRAKIKN